MGDEFGLLTDKEQAFVDSYTEKICKQERERIIALLNDDEVIHNIWWRIKREDNYPSQDFIADVIKSELLTIEVEN
jgi:hypothetical protein